MQWWTRGIAWGTMLTTLKNLTRKYSTALTAPNKSSFCVSHSELEGKARLEWKSLYFA